MKKGYVLFETIVVITLLCVVLVGLYAGYYNIIRLVKSDDKYDNTEYLYKASIIRNYLSGYLERSSYEGSNYYIYCNNDCEGIGDEYMNTLLSSMQVEGIYITKWNVRELDSSDLYVFPATVQIYIKQMDPEIKSGYRIIVMFKDENGADSYQYASLLYSE